MKIRTVLSAVSIIIMIIGTVAIFSPYSLVPTIPAVIQVPWEDPDHETPKAVIQFTFTSKGAFTVNYPIHVKVEIWFREGINYTNVIVHILKPPAQAFQYPLSDPPDAGLIKISEEGNPRVGELDVIFTSQGPFGFVVFSGILPEITNMTVAYVATDKEVIRISPFEICALEVERRGKKNAT